MFLRLFALFTIVPFIELYLLVRLGAATNSFVPLALCLLTAVIGAVLVRQQGFATLMKVQQALAEGRMPSQELLDGLFVVIGAILLATPGVLSDFVGIACLFPPTRALLQWWTIAWLKQHTTIVSMNGATIGGMGEGVSFRMGGPGPFSGPFPGGDMGDPTDGPIGAGRFRQDDPTVITVDANPTSGPGPTFGANGRSTNHR